MADPADNCELTPYAELAEILGALPMLLREERRRRRLSMRMAADQMLMSPSTVLRIERGEDHAASNSATVLRWLGRPAEDGRDATIERVRVLARRLLAADDEGANADGCLILDALGEPEKENDV